MAETEAAVKPWSGACVRCGKTVFVDLLDEEGMCDYCREMKAMKASARRTPKAKKKK